MLCLREAVISSYFKGLFQYIHFCLNIIPKLFMKY